MNTFGLKVMVCGLALMAGFSVIGSRGRAQVGGRAKKVAGRSPGMSNAECLACHGNADLTKEIGGKTVSVFVSEGPLTASVHGSLDCTSCHTEIREYPHEPAPQRVSCAACHAATEEEHRASVHGGTRIVGAPAAGCADCHGSHEIFRATDPRSTVSRFKIAETCSGCHTDPEKIRQYGLAAAHVIQSYRGSSHGRGMFDSGLSVSATCSDCHGAHGVRGKGDPTALTASANLPAMCSKCHLGILNDFERSAHGRLWKSGDTRGPNCATCHNSHDIQSPSLAGVRKQMIDQCGRCHVEQIGTYQQTFHGKATNLGMMVAAKCSDCHTAHLNLPASDPQSSVSKANVVATCARCHSEATARVVSFNPHPQPEKKEEGAAVFYVYQFMKWLLLGVFSFFGLHTLLWFQRSVVAWRRGEGRRAVAEVTEGPYVTRFIVSHRLTHIVIVLSFLGLAFTGIPLHFSQTKWGGLFTSLIGGVEISRFFHRVWAVVTFGYAAWHLWYLARRSGLKWNLRTLFGPESIALRGQDLVDLWRNVKWFLYLGPRPKFDRWTYWEKFDYYAVFWGVPVIGLSGLVLWFPWFFTRLLPGWILNIAMIVHGEEALLAVGFIFTFHFFHNHLRPENFPMDTVIFTGKMPLAKFIEERPAEYERLVSEGRLEEILTTPPSPRARRLSLWFGSFALTVGLAIAIAIFVSLVW